MIRVFSILFLLLCSASAFSQDEINQLDEQGKKTGKWVVKYRNDMIRYEGQFEAGIPVGEFKHYTVEGPLKSTMVYSEKGTKAKATHWYSNKKPLAEGIYRNQLKDSVWVFYSDQGYKTTEETWENGKQEGPQRVYYANGKLAQEYQMVDSVKQGPVKKYFESGQLQEEGTYQDGQLEGTVKRYHPNGMVHSQGKYVNGVRHGRWLHYYFNGKLAEEVVWRNGEIVEKEQQGEFDN